MATADEKVQETVHTAAEKLAEAAAEAAGAAGEALGREPGDDITGLEGNEWSFLTRALMAATVVIVCLIATWVSFKVMCDYDRCSCSVCSFGFKLLLIRRVGGDVCEAKT